MIESAQQTAVSPSLITQLQRVWYWVIEPHPSVPKILPYERAKVLAIITLFLLFVAVLAVLASVSGEGRIIAMTVGCEVRDAQLSLIGGYAYHAPEGKTRSFMMGEGLVGKVARYGEPFLLDSVPEGYLPVIVGLGHIDVQQILLQPCLYDGETLIVLEIGQVQSFTERQKQLPQIVSESIAIAFHSAHIREQITRQLTQEIMNG